MSTKSVHIVFQLLNFLSNPFLCERFELTPDEKLLLIFLAKHKGAKGIYPSVVTLAKELGKTDRTIRRTLIRLKAKGLVLITPVAGHSNFYNLIFPEMDLSTTPDAHVRGEHDIPLTPTSGHPCRPRQGTPDVHVSQSERENNKKEINQRGRKKLAPISPNWKPSNQKLQKLTDEVANAVGTNGQFIVQKFINMCLSKDKTSAYWDGEFENFLMNERPVKWMKGEVPNGVSHQSAPSAPRGVNFTEERLKREAEQNHFVEDEIAKAERRLAERTDIPTPEEVIAMMKAKRINGQANHGGSANDSPRDRDEGKTG